MVNAILACDIKHGIGKNGGLPWPRNDADMKWFAENTRGGILVMGRKTWESIGCVGLKGRINIVLSCSPELVGGTPDMIKCSGSGDIGRLLQNIEHEFPGKTVWVIGGAEVYNQALPFCKNLYLTKFKEEYDCDAFVDKTLLQPFTKLAGDAQSEACSFSIWSRV